MDGEKKKDFIRFEQVSKVYKAGEVEIPALRSADFTISEGEFAVIVGASGAGKTTLLNILGGMDTLTSRRVFVDEREISSLDSKSLTVYRRYDVGFVFQFYNLVPNLPALENVVLAAQICRGPGRPYRQFPSPAVRGRTAESGDCKGTCQKSQAPALR